MKLIRQNPTSPSAPLPRHPSFLLLRSAREKKKKEKRAHTHTHAPMQAHTHTHTLAHKAASSPHPVGWFFIFFSLNFWGKTMCGNRSRWNLKQIRKKWLPVWREAIHPLPWPEHWFGLELPEALGFYSNTDPFPCYTLLLVRPEPSEKPTHPTQRLLIITPGDSSQPGAVILWNYWLSAVRCRSLRHCKITAKPATLLSWISEGWRYVQYESRLRCSFGTSFNLQIHSPATSLATPCTDT